jgi:outer membrane protein OmpA-like peptidoglycan-associated protein
MMAALAAGSLLAMGLGACTSMKKPPPQGAHATPQAKAAVSPCQEATLTLYFDTGSDALTSAGRQIVSLTSQRLRGCQVQELRLVGLSDPAGTPQANVELSQRRADSVLDAFVKAGTPVPKYTLVAAGSKDAVAPTGAVEPLHRRVDVTVVVKP